MITEMIGSPMSGRSTRRSSTMPRTAEKAKVSSSAAPIGACALEIARKTYAPSSRNSPCAKFRMPLDLKMMTKPSATSE